MTVSSIAQSLYHKFLNFFCSFTYWLRDLIIPDWRSPCSSPPCLAGSGGFLGRTQILFVDFLQGFYLDQIFHQLKPLSWLSSLRWPELFIHIFTAETFSAMPMAQQTLCAEKWQIWEEIPLVCVSGQEVRRWWYLIRAQKAVKWRIIMGDFVKEMSPTLEKHSYFVFVFLSHLSCF